MSALFAAHEQELVEIFGANTPFVQDLLSDYEENPSSVKENWQTFFSDLRQGKINLAALETDPKRGANFVQRSVFETGDQKNGEHKNGASSNGASSNGTSSNGTSSNGAPSNGATANSTTAVKLTSSYASLEAAGLTADDKAVTLAGVAGKIVENMETSLSVPTATTVRGMPVKVLEENRIIINQHLQAVGRGKISFTHIIAWAIVRALKKYPSLNVSYASVSGKAYKIERKHINLGLAVDMTKKDGSRSLVVPNIKSAETMNFDRFFEAYNALISKAKTNKLDPADFQGTTASLTNPGTIGTVASVPRLMMGQGLIVATGAIDYTPEYQAMSPALLSQLGISKVMTMTNTYDHRIIQGAESGEFLAYIHKQLLGEDNFYDTIFSDLKMPYKPWKNMVDKNPLSLGGTVKIEEMIEKQARVMQMINSYRVRGHLISNIGNREKMLLRDIVGLLRTAYCEKIGTEYMNITALDQKQWIQKHVEDKDKQLQFSRDEKLEILRDLTRAEGFERYLQTKFLGHKRFSIEGGETAIAILDFIIDEAAKGGTKEVVLGMAHRGRINVLTNVIGKPYDALFAEFEGKKLPMAAGDLTQGSGDVKYHLGATNVRKVKSGNEVRVSVASNPSHLEAVNPVVEGIVRAKQDRANDNEKKQIVPILIHGDAAFAGQGVVAETLNLSQLKGYRTGGTIHLIINNQIGFTTSPDESRSTQYATDMAKMIQAPIFHVNGDDPEACLRVAKIALDYRTEYKRDVVIDMLCYRKHGHNEGDDPAYTQPLMYEKIRKHPGVREMYAQQLIREKTITREESDAINDEFKKVLDDAHEKAKQIAQTDQTIQNGVADLTLAVEDADVAERYRHRNPDTHIELAVLQAITQSTITLPQGFNLNKKLESFLKKREAALGADAMNAPLDWAFAESLAFGSLLLQGFPVRLAGQDSTRGTFSQRHLGFVDTETGAEFIPLQHLTDKAPFYVVDSSLSEYAAMGFEFGYSVTDPLALVMWEAQFGDFVNGAQIMIDQFIAATESKWRQPSGITLLLPHGYEGQGPEHSSARLERFLQLCAEANMQVVNCTTPAQYFHVLRRQVLAGNIKPLVIFTPKSLLRHPLAISKVSELVGDKFHNVLDDVETIVNPKRVVLCSGKIYYDLLAERAQRGVKDVALIRVEQLYPYPEVRLDHLLEKYKSATEICWVQEEPKNMGAWSFIAPHLVDQIETLKLSANLRYIGRAAAASPATGFLKKHEAEQKSICGDAMA
jgi:multifunctional 2-oxoglutarate metabolism enzyme